MKSSDDQILSSGTVSIKEFSHSAENSSCVGNPLLVQSCCKLFSCAQHLGLNPARCWTTWPQSSKALRHTFNIAKNATPFWLMSPQVLLYINVPFFFFFFTNKNIQFPVSNVELSPKTHLCFYFSCRKYNPSRPWILSNIELLNLNGKFKFFKAFNC